MQTHAEMTCLHHGLSGGEVVLIQASRPHSEHFGEVAFGPRIVGQKTELVRRVGKQVANAIPGTGGRGWGWGDRGGGV